RDIAPIFGKNCQSCHRAGEGAPVSLNNYKPAAQWASKTKEVTARRIMPLWMAASHGEFLIERLRAEPEIGTSAATGDPGPPAVHPGPGYRNPTPGNGPGFFPTVLFAGWAPGNDPRFLPAGVGNLLPKGADIVLEVHYHKDGKPERDQTQIGVYFAKGPVDKRI